MRVKIKETDEVFKVREINFTKRIVKCIIPKPILNKQFKIEGAEVKFYNTNWFIAMFHEVEFIDEDAVSWKAKYYQLLEEMIFLQSEKNINKYKINLKPKE